MKFKTVMDALLALLPIVVGFVLTGVIGNRLLQAWQARNWLMQQRFLGQEKEYLGLKELADEIVTLLGVRIFYMQRLNRALRSGSDDKVDTCLQEYDEALRRWNERLTSFYIRLPMLAGNGLELRLENSIQAELVKTGGTIESLVANRKAGMSIHAKQTTQVENDLHAIQGKAIAFNRHLLVVVRSRRADVYYGKRLVFSPQNLRHFSTWQLIEALFVRNIDSLTVIRPPLDS
jgi:hypothetical protein